MIWFVTGKPGDGKSYAATKMLLDDLKKDIRPIVTNLHLDKKAIATWLVKSGLHPWVAVHRVESRLFYLPDDDLQEFYRYRAGVYLDPEKDIALKGRKGKVPQFPETGDGVIYYLDEVHIAFPARNWQGNGDNVMFYNSQHRKLKDDVFFITQSSEMVDKIFRELAQGTYHCRNMYRLKFGMFKHAGCFKRELVYSTAKRSANMMVVEKVEYPLDKAVGACFATMAGVGLQTTNKPELKKAGGIDLRLLWLLIPISFFGIIWSMDAGRGAMSNWFAGTLTGQAAAAQKSVAPLSPSPSRSVAPVRVATPSASVPVRVEPVPPVVGARGDSAWPIAVVSGARAVVYSDGSRAPLERVPHAIRGRWATVEDYRVPVL